MLPVNLGKITACIIWLGETGRTAGCPDRQEPAAYGVAAAGEAGNICVRPDRVLPLPALRGRLAPDRPGPAPDLQEEYAEISDWILDASERYGDRLQVTLVDPASLGGFWKALHHRVRRFPSFVVDGRERIGGFEHDRLDMCRVPFGTSMRSNSRPTRCMSGGRPHTPKLCSEPSGKRQSGAWLPTGRRSPAVPANTRLLLSPVLAPVAR